jgi:uncharacterized protein YggE
MPDETKQFELSNRLFVVFAILLVGVLGFWTAKVFIDFQSLPNNYPREITVSGEGRTFAVPDIALIQLGAVTEGLEVGDVVRENTEKMNNILKEIKTLGIEEKDIKTTTYNLAPRYEWTEDGKRIFKGYTLTQQISVKIRNFEKIGDVLEKTTEKGANLVGDLQFSIDEPEKVRQEARKEAIERAKAKASQISTDSGLKLVKLVNVYEDYYPRTYSDTLYKSLEATGGGEIAAPPEIQPGEQEVTVTIYLTYRVR